MGPEGIILLNPPNTTLQQSLTHSALQMWQVKQLSFYWQLDEATVVISYFEDK